MFYISFSSASNVNMSIYFWLGFELFRKKIYFSSDVIGLWQIVVSMAIRDWWPVDGKS